MTTEIYQDWLTDRGIHSLISQPFVLVGSDVDPSSLTLIVASSGAGDSSTQPAVIRLAKALKGLVSHPVSWVIINQEYDAPKFSVLRGMMPMLTNIVMLVGPSPHNSETLPDAERPVSFPVEEQVLASRPLRVMVGPQMQVMASDLGLKKQLWNQLRAWILPIQSS